MLASWLGINTSNFHASEALHPPYKGSRIQTPNITNSNYDVLYDGNSQYHFGSGPLRGELALLVTRSAPSHRKKKKASHIRIYWPDECLETVDEYGALGVVPVP